MIINWHGQACFKIQSDTATVVTDPLGKDYGLKVPRFSADILTISHDHGDHNNIEAVKGIDAKEPFTIRGAGEYEYKKIFIYGIPSYHDEADGKERGSNIIYRFEIEGVSVTHLGDLGHQLSQHQLEMLEGTDVLLIPVGGIYTLDAKQANNIITQIEPRIVIPMHYHIDGLKTPKKIDGLDVFCKEIGICPKEHVSKLKIVKKDLPQEDLQVVTFEA